MANDTATLSAELERLYQRQADLRAYEVALADRGEDDPASDTWKTAAIVAASAEADFQAALIRNYCTISRVLREAAEGWSFDMDAAPKDGTDLDLFDEIGVVLGAYTWPQSLKEWWETVGEEDEEPDVEGYQEYLEGEMFGWIGCEPLSTDVLYLNPIAWRHRPRPPVLPPPPSEAATLSQETRNDD